MPTPPCAATTLSLPPAEFQSGNTIPVTRATIKRERMVEIIGEVAHALLPDEAVALLATEVARLTEQVERLEAEKNKAATLTREQGEEAPFDEALAKIAMRFVDRASDYCKEDPAEAICDQFHEAVADVVDRRCAMRGMRSEKYDRKGELKTTEVTP